MYATTDSRWGRQPSLESAQSLSPDSSFGWASQASHSLRAFRRMNELISAEQRHDDDACQTEREHAMV